METSIWELILSAVVSGSVVSGVVSFLLLHRAERIKKEIETQYKRIQDAVKSQRTWKETAVAELLGPMWIQLDRTKRAFSRYNARNLYLEASVLREGNLAIRDLLLSHAHLIPPELFEHAGALIEHYDRWLEEFERTRAAESPNPDTEFVFVGPHGYPFPIQSERAFVDVYKRYWSELYRVEAAPTS